MIYFISDVHLGLLERSDDRKREALFLNVLQKCSLDAEKIYFVGDIFDYWFEYKTVTPKYFYRTLTAIAGLRDSGIPIEYVMGNHDFGHKEFFMEEFGIEIHKGDIEREHYGKKFYISHGDGKSYKDTGYKILKKIIRAKLSLFLFLKLHPDFGIRLASGSSRKSRVYTDKKVYGEKDGMRDFAFSKLESGFDYVIMGHRHKAEKSEHSGGYYINLGEWMRNPTFGIFDGNEFKITEVEKFLKND
jgi:UDP-2,3-diacylglucosamine hydrolase